VSGRFWTEDHQSDDRINQINPVSHVRQVAKKGYNGRLTSSVRAGQKNVAVD